MPEGSGNVSVADGMNMGRSVPKRPSELDMAMAWDIVSRGTDGELDQLKANVVFHLNSELELPTGRQKGKLPHQLKQYVHPVRSLYLVDCGTDHCHDYYRGANKDL